MARTQGWLLVCVALCGGCLSAKMPPLHSTGLPVASVSGGLIQGSRENGITSFKGIPYAAAPIGAFRWRSPQAVIPWSGIRSARAAAAPCAQSEDCLYLDIWSPSISSQEKLPVMVWLYGGVDGSQFARDGVVLVSVANRDGIFGFLAHPDLRRDGERGSGNFGLEDQIAALKWVQANIEQFRGDPERVTIFGVSRGGMAVSLLAVMPAARGLFHRAIAESGAAFSSPMLPGYARERAGHLRSLSFAEGYGKKFIEELGVSSVEAARSLPTDTVVRAAASASQYTYWPTLDGDLIPGSNADLYAGRRFYSTPILLGSNSDEGTGFGQQRPAAAQIQEFAQTEGCQAQAKSVLDLYATDAVADERSIFDRVTREKIFAWNAWTWARLQSLYGHHDAYLYVFDVRTASRPNGPRHGEEVAYVFGTLNHPRPEDLHVSALMRHYWINFAAHGDPNGDGLPAWPAFHENTSRALVFDKEPSARNVPNLERIKAMDAYNQCVIDRTRPGGSPD